MVTEESVWSTCRHRSARVSPRLNPHRTASIVGMRIRVPRAASKGTMAHQRARRCSAGPRKARRRVEVLTGEHSDGWLDEGVLSVEAVDAQLPLIVDSST